MISRVSALTLCVHGEPTYTMTHRWYLFGAVLFFKSSTSWPFRLGPLPPKESRS